MKMNQAIVNEINRFIFLAVRDIWRDHKNEHRHFIFDCFYKNIDWLLTNDFYFTADDDEMMKYTRYAREMMSTRCKAEFNW